MDTQTLNNIYAGIIGGLLTTVGWFLRRLYAEIQTWKTQTQANQKELGDTLHRIDKRVYRLEILNPQIDNSVVEPTGTQ